MFPTTHDITALNVSACATVLEKLLAAGNRVLIVSKPNLAALRVVLSRCEPWRDQVMFRFSITTADEDLARWWEPGAPSIRERIECLYLAHSKGWRTSVSAEPCLDLPRVNMLLARVLLRVSHSIWIGTMNKVAHRVAVGTAEDADQVARIVAGQEAETVRAVYERHKDNPKIRWKAEIKEILGLPLATEVGEEW